MKNRFRNKTAYEFEVSTMSDATYELRRKVMDIIYKAKKVVELPRIEVRIVEGGHKNVAGYAYMGGKVIHIPIDTVNKSQTLLEAVVLHEIVHAVTGFGHDEKCPLMHPMVDPTRCNKAIWKAFKSYFNK